MSEWITDRLPTQEEAGRFGFVIIPSNQDRTWDSAVASGIKLGQPWAPFPKMPPFEPQPEPWSKPSDFPPVCWLFVNESDTVCRQVTGFDTSLGRIILHGRKVAFENIRFARWSDRPFDRFEDGKPCVKGGNDE
jgi:hypothetical protein